MTTDRELLELAAKAAGEDIFIDSEGRAWIRGTCVAWVPQDDDGQALRLAVKLGIDIAKANVQFYVKSSTDPYAANRRAIFLTAVEIGRNMG